MAITSTKKSKKTPFKLGAKVMKGFDLEKGNIYSLGKNLPRTRKTLTKVK